ncbi:MAG: DUF1501 domain-containing protein, partial [Pirellulales bacterium]
MLRLLGSNRTLCHGVTRRDFIRVGGLGMAGLGLADVLALQESAAADGAARPKSFGRAKSIILLHLYGAPSQIETFDPKPDAPLEIRGELKSIESSLPGCRVCELLPNAAKVMDRVTVLRSMTHDYPIHGVAFALTGVPRIDIPMELNPRDANHWPFFGSVVQYVDEQHPRASPIPPGQPQNVSLPFRFSSRRVGEVPRAGPYAAFLGGQYDPLWTDFVGKATRGIPKTLRDLTYTDNDPYMGVEPDGRFVLPASAAMPAELTLDRLDRRRSLLAQLNDARADLTHAASARQLSRHQATALSMIDSPRLGTALDVRRESKEARELYGMTLFGQACLAARRLVEAGTRVVTVFWDEYGLAGMGWDTHWNHYPRMKQELCPGFDLAWHGLITDLDRRGLLDDTLVVCTSEHGRTPKITPENGGGRDHWSRVYSTLMAGGGIACGRVVGASDKHGGEVADRPISPKDQLATMYHLLGIDPHTMLRDAVGRPLPLVDGRV